MAKGKDTSSSLVPEDYGNALALIKDRIIESKHRSVMSVNAHMLFLYWEIGTYVAERQRLAGWGAKVIKTLSKDIKSALPETKGFSARNILYMVQFAETYPLVQIDDSNLQPVVAQIDENSKKDIDEEESEVERSIVQPVVAQINYSLFSASPLSQVSWSHHVILMDKTKSPEERTYYINRSISEGWSRRVLAHKIEEGLYHSQGNLPNNFDTTLAPMQSELAKSILKDPYIFDFLNIGEAAKERDLEMALLKDITKFLLELGKGFALMGQQYHMAVGGQDYYLDLLFYHTHLRCHFIIELKMDDFKPEYAGKLNFYINAADDLIKMDHDQPTIGLLLCKSANKVVAEYTLKDMAKPIGVATYKLLPKTEDLIELLQSKEIESKKAEA